MLNSSLPFGPFTLSSAPLSLTSTPAGSVTGNFATLDMAQPIHKGCVILEAHLQHRLAIGLVRGEVLDVTLVLQHLGDGGAQLGRRHAHAHLLRQLGVANACQHIGYRIGHHIKSVLSSEVLSFECPKIKN